MEMSVAQIVRQALQNLATRREANLAIPESGAVEPHMAVDSLALEPALAWQATLEVLPKPFRTQLITPAGWPAWMERLPATGWVVHALGEFPQRLDMESVLKDDFVSSVLEDHPGLPTGNCPVDQLFSAALSRQAGQWRQAQHYLDRLTETCLVESVINERAALAWQQGDRRAAEKLWESCPPLPGILYNRALARCAAGQMNVASELFSRAAEGWPESSPWHHLARVCELTVGGQPA